MAVDEGRKYLGLVVPGSKKPAQVNWKGERSLEEVCLVAQAQQIHAGS